MTKRYKAKINPYYISFYIALIGLGLFSIYLNRDDLLKIESYFPQIFTAYGTLMLIIFFKTKYFMMESGLKIKSGFKIYEINYKKITKVIKRKINPFFRYGYASGIIRGETDTNVLWITYQEKLKKNIIMISPKEMSSFIKELGGKCPNVDIESS